MKRPERNQNSEAEKEQRENELLRGKIHRLLFEMLCDFNDVECAFAERKLKIECNQSNEREQRAETEIKRDLKRCVVLVFAATPHADHDERRNKREFVEE